MNKRTLRERENTITNRGLKQAKRVQRKASRTSKAQKKDVLGFIEAPMAGKEPSANYDSDYSSTGAYTPYSSLSFASKSTRFTVGSRRKQKIAHKSYNLRKRPAFGNDGVLTRSLLLR